MDVPRNKPHRNRTPDMLGTDTIQQHSIKLYIHKFNYLISSNYTSEYTSTSLGCFFNVGCFYKYFLIIIECINAGCIFFRLIKNTIMLLPSSFYCVPTQKSKKKISMLEWTYVIMSLCHLWF